MKKYIIAALCGLSLICSCSKNCSEDPVTGTDIIRISSAIGIDRSTKAAITDGIFPETRDMTVSAYNATSGQDHFQSALFQHSAQGWTSDKSWPQSGTLDFLAYSSGNLTVSGIGWGSPNSTSSVQMTMPDNSSTQEDLLLGCAVSKSSGSDVVIDFRHAQAYLAFTAKATQGYDAALNRGVTVSGITLKSAAYSGTVLTTRTEGELSFSWSTLSSYKTLAVPGLSSVDLSSAPSTLGNGILLPAQDEVGFTITYTMHNGKDASGNPVNTTFSYDFTPSPAITWEAGRKYTYSIEITLSGITVTPSVAPWTTGTNREIIL